MDKTLKIIFATLSTIGTLAIIVIFWELAVKPLLISDNPIPDPTPTITPSPTSTPSPSEPSLTEIPLNERFSSGDRRLFTNPNNPNVEQGIAAFKAGNYEEAYQQFSEAIKTKPINNDPEIQIYLNNSQARKGGNPLILAAVVPVDQKRTNAEEMLRGVAQAQTEFNQQAINGRLLEIIIVNDSNEPNHAQQVAKKIVNNNNILGVIGHNSSSATAEGLKEYETAKIAMISPTSTSTSLSGNVFFRTVPSDAKAGEFLATYAINNNINNVAIFYTSTSNYSQSIKDAFVENVKILGTATVIDMSLPSFSSKNTVEALQNQVDAFVIFPNTDNKIINLALQVADTNANLANPKKLLGGDALYNPATLKLSKGGVKDLVLAVPWFAKSSYPYTNLAEKRWGGRVSWRTATSYDATKAFITALSENATRKSILTNLQQTELSSNETSGEPIQFLKSGDRNTNPLLVRVIPKSSNFAEYDFEIIND